MSDARQWPQLQPDDTQPTPERQAELRAAYEKNVAAGKPPYAGAIIRTRGEVNWIKQERGWKSGSFNMLDQIDFRQVVFRNATLDGVELSYANLGSAFIDDSSFAGATLAFADLSGMITDGSNFTDCFLVFTNLSGAHLIGTFTGASFTFANLSGANVIGDFSAADLTQVRMDATTILGSVFTETKDARLHFNEKTHVLDVAWNGAILANVDWGRIPRLGDEIYIKAAKNRKERVKALRNAARAYRGLAKALQAQGLTIPALRYRAREQQLERRALLYSFALGPWLFSWLLNLVSGYGDKPGRALACYLAVVGAFAALYWAITNQVFGFIHSQSVHLAWYEALVLSISSFHGRGFFPSALTLGDPIAVVAAAEAIIGLFIELVFIATFTQRFFAR